MDTPPLPRGIRNKNPANIKLNALNHWHGQIPGDDDAFCAFSDPKYGLRAAMKLIRQAYLMHNCVTVRQQIARWAPPNENDTLAYEAAVAACMNVDPNAVLTLDQATVVTMAEAIVLHENGKPPDGYPPYWYDTSVYNEAYSLLP